MTIKPNGKCYVCNNSHWWTPDGGGRWLCGNCHPDPSLELHRQPILTTSRPAIDTETEALAQRVAAGNQKLIYARTEINKISDAHELAINYNAWTRAVENLNALSKELQTRGFKGCYYTSRPYEEEKIHELAKCNSWPDGMCCLVCGDADIFWDMVIARSPSPRRPRTETSDELIKFLETLGGKI